jgi:hypothetical protein
MKLLEWWRTIPPVLLRTGGARWFSVGSGCELLFAVVLFVLAIACPVCLSTLGIGTAWFWLGVAILIVGNFAWTFVLLIAWGRFGERARACDGRVCLGCGYGLPDNTEQGRCSECGRHFVMEENRRRWGVKARDRMS